MNFLKGLLKFFGLMLLASLIGGVIIEATKSPEQRAASAEAQEREGALYTAEYFVKERLKAPATADFRDLPRAQFQSALSEV